MALFKRVYTTINPKTGRKVKRRTAKWYGQYRDPAGHIHRVPLATDKVAAAQKLADLVKRAERGQAGVSDPFEKHTGRLLADHLEEFRRHMESKGNTAAYVKETVAKVQAIIDGCGFRFIADVSASSVTEWLAACRSGDEDMGIATSNHYLTAVKGFSRWLVSDRRTAENPLVHLSRLNADVDVRRDRRALSAEELVLLLAAAESGPTRWGLTGKQRVLLYVAAVGTGLRASELASLTQESFDMVSDPATVTVAAGYSKRRRTDVLPLHSDLAARLRDSFTEQSSPTDDPKPVLRLRNASDAKRSLLLARRLGREAARRGDAEGRPRSGSNCVDRRRQDRNGQGGARDERFPRL
jgi:integrase